MKTHKKSVNDHGRFGTPGGSPPVTRGGRVPTLWDPPGRFSKSPRIGRRRAPGGRSAVGYGGPGPPAPLLARSRTRGGCPKVRGTDFERAPAGGPAVAPRGRIPERAGGLLGAGNRVRERAPGRVPRGERRTSGLRPAPPRTLPKVRGPVEQRAEGGTSAVSRGGTLPESRCSPPRTFGPPLGSLRRAPRGPFWQRAGASSESGTESESGCGSGRRARARRRSERGDGRGGACEARRHGTVERSGGTGQGAR